MFHSNICLGGCYCLSAQQKASYGQEDTRLLLTLPARWEHYWNIHNMDSMGTLLINDVDFVNVAGVWMKGKAAAVKDHKEKHIGVSFKTSLWQTDSVNLK